MKQTPQTQTYRGFTLIEVLMVMTIIIILASLTVGGLQFVKTRQNNNKAEIQINLLSRGLEEYNLDNGDYPGDEDAGGANGTGETNMLFQALYYDGFEAMEAGDESATIYLSDLDPLNDSQKWLEGSGSTATIVDPWKNEYLYRRGSGAFNPDYDLWSKGKDSETEGDGEADKDKDDIRNF
jgi:prepilin-type N-terminal cleavage/methylation domain-containing protein